VEVKGGISKAGRSVAWSCDGKKVAVGTEFKGLRVWDAKAGVRMLYCEMVGGEKLIER